MVFLWRSAQRSKRGSAIALCAEGDSACLMRQAASDADPAARNSEVIFVPMQSDVVITPSWDLGGSSPCRVTTGAPGS
ncbi:hypothetical protein C8R45DRAFT_1107371 [Mycena sanguinolenta]|nr:hypothetical protein C8R45DRAFT_1107371 [Mycena sanguinolenta]